MPHPPARDFSGIGLLRCEIDRRKTDAKFFTRCCSTAKAATIDPVE
jgi:hypothetical protein